MSLFREEAQRRRNDTLHGAIVIHNQIGWTFVAIVTVLTFAATYVILGVATYPVTASANGVLKSEAGVVNVVAPRAGTISRIYVNTGDQVGEGQQLLAVSTENVGASGRAAGPIIDASLLTQENRVTAQMKALDERYAAQSRGTRAQVAALQAEIASFNQREQSLVHLLQSAEEDYDQARRIAARGYLSRRDLTQREEAVYLRRNALATLRGERGAKIAQLAQLAADLECGDDAA